MQKQVELLGRRVFLLSVTTATNMIDQLQHLMAQLHNLLNLNSASETRVGRTVAVDPPPAAMRDSKLRPQSKVSEPALEEWEQRLISPLPLETRPKISHPSSSLEIITNPSRASALEQRRTRLLVKCELRSLLNRFSGLRAAWECHPWGLSIRLQFRRAILGVRLPLAYPSERCKCDMVPLSPETLGGFYQRVVLEEDWHLFSPITLTAIVSLFVHSVQEQPMS